MYNILFVCYGNICRSPMAEMIFKDLIYKNNKRYMLSCVSRATSMEEIGNDIYPKAKDILLKNDIAVERHIARQVQKEEYDKFDYIIVMEERNKRDLLRIFGEDTENKIHLLLEYTNKSKNIEDPWYTGDFETAFKEINNGCIALFNHLVKQEGENEKHN